MLGFSVLGRGRRLTVRARAKVNLGLEVLGRRPDGYHELVTVMSAIDLADRVALETTDTEDIELACDLAGVPAGADNLAWRAAELLRQEARTRQGLRIRIVKAIPVAAGLGGGSVDAAAVLVGASRLWGLSLPAGRVQVLATALGMDVPFFLGAGPALASGRGERLAAVARTRSLPLVVVNPGFPLSTAEVYGRLGPADFSSGGAVRALVDALPGGARTVAPRLYNGLERAVAEQWPGLIEVKTALVEAGALGAVMSGSGPTVIGVAPSGAAARRIRSALAARPWRTWVTRTVAEPALTVRAGWVGGTARGVASWGVAKR
jgi:4-diphosphocytidyl-2-C-methyl-D-erythritol kinase